MTTTKSQQLLTNQPTNQSFFFMRVIFVLISFKVNDVYNNVIIDSTATATVQSSSSQFVS